MLVSIRAKFRTIRDAESAFKSVNSQMTTDHIDMVTNRNIKEHAEKENFQEVRKGTTKAALIGAMVGLMFGILFVFQFNVGGAEISSLLASVLFSLAGAVAGIVFSTAIYYISREKEPSISENDLKREEAMLIITLKDQALGKLRKILRSSNVEKIYRA